MFYLVLKKGKMVTERLDAQIEQKKNAHYKNTSYNNEQYSIA